jgi:hypothetical protein
MATNQRNFNLRSCVRVFWVNICAAPAAAFFNDFERLLFKQVATLPESDYPSKSVWPFTSIGMKGETQQMDGGKAEMGGK